MVSVNSGDTLELGDGDTLEIGDYEIYYNSQEDRWEVENSASKRSDGNIQGAEYSSGKVGYHCLDFNGYSDMVEINSVSNLVGGRDFTISVWFKTSEITKIRNTVFAFNTATGGNTIIIYASALFDDVDGTNRTYNANTTDGSWHHLALVHDESSGENQVYIDGSSDISTSVAATVKGDDKASIGQEYDADTKSAFFKGKIDDFRTYDRALSSSEVVELYNYGNDGSSMPPTDGLVAHYDFEQPEDPNTAVDTSTITHVPKNSSGSLFPTDLGDVLQGKALADDGNIYDSVQTAVDNASGYVFIGPGTFNESVTIDTSGLMMEGCGRDTLIDPGSGSDAITVSSATDVTVQNLSARTDSGQGSGYNAFTADSNSNKLTVRNVTVRQSDGTAITCGGSDTMVSNCTIENGDDGAIHIDGDRGILTNCNADGVGGRNLQTSHDSICANNVVLNSGSRSINEGNNDAITIGNRVHNSNDDGIYVNVSNDVIIANNRVSDSSGTDINIKDAAVDDDNLGGAAN